MDNDVTNAAATKDGYNYQDVVALGYFIKNIKMVNKIKDEGKGDVDLLYSDGSIEYLQVKGTGDVTNQYKTKELKEALRELINKFNLSKKPSSIVYVTNSHYPLGKDAEDYDFKKEYSGYLYENFTDKITKKIYKQIFNIRKDYENKKQKSLNEFIYNLSDTDLAEILKKLSIVKFSFEGTDENKLTLIKSYIKELLIQSKADNSVSIDNILYSLYCRMNISSGNRKSYITKKAVVSEIFFSSIDHDKHLDDFVSYCNIDFGDEDEIIREAKKLQDLFLNKYPYDSTIKKMYKDYLQDNPVSKNTPRNQILGLFINENINELSLVLDIKNKEDVVKYIIWVMMFSSSKLKNIMEACNYEN